MINIAKLNQRIEIQHLTSTKDSRGNPEEVWTTVCKRWAAADLASGTKIDTRHERQSATAGYDGPEFYAAGNELVEKKVLFETRYSKQLEMIDTTEYRIIWKGRIYDVKDVDNQGGLNEKLIITAICKDSNNAITTLPTESEGGAGDQG